MLHGSISRVEQHRKVPCAHMRVAAVGRTFGAMTSSVWRVAIVMFEVLAPGNAWSAPHLWRSRSARGVAEFRAQAEWLRSTIQTQA